MVAQDKKDRYDNIMKAAYEEFYQYGYESAKMEKIAQRAGIGKSTIYEYFPSKRELLIQVCQEGFKYITEELKKIFLEKGSLRDKIHKLLQKEFAHSMADLTRMTRLWESASHIPEVEETACQNKEDIFSIFDQVLKQAQECHEIRKDADPQILMLWIQTLGMTIIVNQEPFSQEKIETLLDFFFLGLKPRL